MKIDWKLVEYMGCSPYQYLSNEPRFENNGAVVAENDMFEILFFPIFSNFSHFKNS